MNNAYAMSASFEARKNSQATMITAGFAGLLLLLMFLIKWSLPDIPPPIVEEGIEVNLGTSDQGFGKDQPMMPGEPAPKQQIATAMPQQSKSEVKDAKDIEEDKNDKEAVTILKPKVSKPDSKEINKETRQAVKVVKSQPVVVVQPQRPKAVLNRVVGSTGVGGNGADSYQKGSNEGIAGGNGDQGKVGGTPNSPNYTGNPGHGNGGPRVMTGDRKIIRYYSFQGDLEKAVLYVDIRVSPDGVGQFMQITKGSTTNSQAYKNAISEYLRNIRFDRSDHESTVNVQFNFRVN
jgi:hypothetical protein